MLRQDLSSNGTFVNGRKVRAAGGGRRQWLAEGDRVSLVMSITPLSEQWFLFHAGAPQSPAPPSWSGL